MEVLNTIGSLITGTRKERVAQAEVDKLKRRRQLSNNEQAKLRLNESITRRLFIRRSLAASLGVTGAVGLPLAWKAFSPSGEAPVINPVTKSPAVPVGVVQLPQQSYFEEVYQNYLKGYEQIAQYDPQANNNLDLLHQRRIRAITYGGSTIFENESRADFNIVTVITDPNQSPDLYFGGTNFSVNAFASFGTLDGYPVLFFRSDPVNQIWAGSVLAHETEHAEQHFRDPSRASRRGISADTIAENEQGAYALQFRLLNGYSMGRFNEILDHSLEYLPKDGIFKDVPDQPIEELSALFGPSEGEKETKNRKVNFIIALNFRNALLNSESTAEATRRQVEAMKEFFVVI